MEVAQMFKRNSAAEDLFKLVGQCIRHCRTINKDNLTLDDQKCLQNCGYNKAFLNGRLRDIFENVTWGQEESAHGFQ